MSLVCVCGHDMADHRLLSVDSRCGLCECTAFDSEVRGREEAEAELVEIWKTLAVSERCDNTYEFLHILCRRQFLKGREDALRWMIKTGPENGDKEKISKSSSSGTALREISR